MKNIMMCFVIAFLCACTADVNEKTISMSTTACEGKGGLSRINAQSVFDNSVYVYCKDGAKYQGRDGKLFEAVKD